MLSSTVPSRSLAATSREAAERAGEQVGFHTTHADIATAMEQNAGGFNLVIDATGVAAAIQEAFGAVAKSGRFLQVGVAPPEAELRISPFQIYNQEITVLGSMAVLNSYAPALRLLADNAVNVTPMLTHNLPLESYHDAFEALRRGDGLKIQLDPTKPATPVAG